MTRFGPRISKDDQVVIDLAQRIEAIIPGLGMTSVTVALGMVRDPHGLVDALCEAGVLRWNAGLLELAQPHIHEWRVEKVVEGGHVTLYCQNCPYPEGRTTVPNRLPIEMPS